jgi:hypothetical protein
VRESRDQVDRAGRRQYVGIWGSPREISAVRRLIGGAIRTRTMDPLGWVCEICAKSDCQIVQPCLVRVQQAKRKRKGSARGRYRRFATAAEAIRFAIEGFPALRPLGAWMRERCDFRRNDDVVPITLISSNVCSRGRIEFEFPGDPCSSGSGLVSTRTQTNSPPAMPNSAKKRDTASGSDPPGSQQGANVRGSSLPSWPEVWRRAERETHDPRGEMIPDPSVTFLRAPRWRRGCQPTAEGQETRRTPAARRCPARRSRHAF